MDTRGQRAMDMEHESAMRLLSENYLNVVRKCADDPSQRADRADCKFFEGLFRLTDRVVEQIYRFTPPEHLQMALSEVHRVFRGPNFNIKMHARHGSPKRQSWAELQPGSDTRAKKSALLKLPEKDRKIGFARAVEQRSPLLSMKYPSVAEQVKMYNQATKKQQFGIPGLPPRCVPTTQRCITGTCASCSRLRASCAKQFFDTQRLSSTAKATLAPLPEKAPPVPVQVKARLRTLAFDAARLERESVIDLATSMLEDCHIFQKLGISADGFTSFLIDIRALHKSQMGFTNWIHSVNTCHMLYYILVVGGGSAHFTVEEAFLMMLATLCSGVHFPGNDPFLVTSRNELAMLQRTGPRHSAHFRNVVPEVISVGRRSHCDIFSGFKNQEMDQVKFFLEKCFAGFDVVPMTSKIQKEFAELPPEPSSVSSKISQGWAAGRKMGGMPSLKALSKGSLGLKKAKKVGNHLFGELEWRKTMPGEDWIQKTNFELVQLIMTASWLFYPTQPKKSSIVSMRWLNKELYNDGEKLLAEIPPDVDPATVIAACHNRKAANPPLSHSMVVELILTPLYRVIKHKLGATANVSNITAEISSFHVMLQKEMQDKREAAKREEAEKKMNDQKREMLQRQRAAELRAMGLASTQPLPEIRPSSTLTAHTTVHEISL